jgi:tetratricopeptide (TPR) repeat protein
VLRTLIGRIVLVCLAGAYLATLAISFSGAWALRNPTPQRLEWGMRWNPTNHALWEAFGREFLYEPQGSQPERTTPYLLRAAALNPLEPSLWANLANVYQQTGDAQKTEAALRASLLTAPHSPEAAWRLANFLIVLGRTDEAIPYLRGATLANLSLRFAAFDLGWKILDAPDEMIRQIVPPVAEVQADYLAFAMSRKHLAGSYPVWEELRRSSSPNAVKIGYAYVDALTAADHIPEAVRVWDELLADTGRSAAKPEGELCTNGDFETDLPNAGLDWRLGSDSGYKIQVDNLVAQHGSRSLRVTFDGSTNPDFGAVAEIVPVEPGREYLFTGHIKTENITSDSGPRFEIAASSPVVGERFSLRTADRLGTNTWEEEHLDFRPGPSTHTVTVYLRRLPSGKLNNLLGGRVWIDNLSIKVKTKHSPEGH